MRVARDIIITIFILMVVVIAVVIREVIPSVTGRVISLLTSFGFGILIGELWKVSARKRRKEKLAKMILDDSKVQEEQSKEMERIKSAKGRNNIDKHE